MKWKTGSYTGVFGKNVINAKQEGKKIIFSGICEGKIEAVCTQYFDLGRDYEQIKETLSKVDGHLRNSICYGNGIRLLNQDLWETMISFIISANNNIPRIKKIIERLCITYGDQIKWRNKIYYTFPTPMQLSKASIQDLRDLGLGFRDKRIYETTKMVLEKNIDLEQLSRLEDTNLLRDKLIEAPGVGEKVADCIMLFSTLKHLDVFPVDVWVRRVMNELYIHSEDEAHVDKEKIRLLAKQKYGNLAGVAQQYLFYWKRETA